MVKIVFTDSQILYTDAKNYLQVVEAIEQALSLKSSDFYLVLNGKILAEQQTFDDTSVLRCCLRVCGGKGGFGSMLRAIGAQIEKTTNREACRDLSGRRLRDINEEKRLKAWIEKQAEREREAEERKKRKIEKLLAVPKHDFKDEEYEEARSKLTEKVNDAVEEGFKKAEQSKKMPADETPEPSTSKRKAETSTSVRAKKKKATLWIGDDISDTNSDSSDSESASPIKDKRLK